VRSTRSPGEVARGQDTQAAQGGRLHGISGEDIGRLVTLYRDVCADLARAQAARYSAGLVDWLQGLTRSAHAAVYGAKARAWSVDLRDFFTAFPRALRSRRRALAIASALFFVPFAICFAVSLFHPDFALRVLPESQLRPLADAYAKGFSEGRAGGESTLMAGFYVENNVGIALRCFATGIFGGIGSAFFLVYNGLVLGATAGYIVAQGAGPNLFTFVAGHTPFELGAIVIAGAAGLSMGWSIVAPGELPRLVSLQRAARDVIVVVAGASAMLLIAASIEGFLSGSSVPAHVKWIVGAVGTALVTIYLSLAGRNARWT
jgi:uncharacterized membrane protein SpoIIM required for sporulation